MTRERQHSHGIASATKDVGPKTAPEVDGWPGKQPLTMDLGWPGPHPLGPDSGELVADRAVPDVVAVDAREIEALDRGVAEITRRPTARSEEDDQELWIAQQQRSACWKQVVGWADEHRARRPLRRSGI